MMCGEPFSPRLYRVVDPALFLGGVLLFGVVGMLSCGCNRQVTGADPVAKQSAPSVVEAMVDGSSAGAITAPMVEPTSRESGRTENEWSNQSQQPELVAQELPSSRIDSRVTIIDSTFDDIKFEMENTQSFIKSMLTPKVEQLFGKRIRIRGYIYPTLRKRGLKQFVLVRDNLECCFGPGAAIFDCILVEMVSGTTAEYTIRPVAVEGTFRFEALLGPNGKHVAIYRLEGEKVE